MTDKMRVGVVGVGYLGKIHARIYARMPNVELIGVVDTDPAAAEAVARECGCKAYTETAALLDGIDAVSIVVPTVYHLEVARPFLERGIHMLLEKPIASTLEQGAEIIRLAEQGGAVLQIGHLERYNAGVMKLASRIKNPRFIEAHRIGEFVARATDVDVVTDLMIHDIDIILSLVGAPLRHISATGLPVLTNHVDIANARLEFENGCVANVTASRVSHKRLRRIRIFEENNYEALNFIDQQIDSVKTLRSDADQEWPEIVREKVEIEPCQPLDAELADFVQTIRKGGKPLVDGATGLEALRVAMEVKEKIEQ
ncbi:MAG: gfo/Idh/MocA family oxidoreductase [Proteobacteria bacterium]|nr:MAG: gfo/Idh/MocA family oxidoreductase [Pseudomonadota bacterium]